MTAVPSIDPARFLNEQLAQASPDLLRDLLTTFLNALRSAQADAVCGAGRLSGQVPHGEVDPGGDDPAGLYQSDLALHGLRLVAIDAGT